MGRIAWAAVAAMALSAAGCEMGPEDPNPTTRLPTTEIRVGYIPLTIEVAKTDPDRRRGMMFRRSLGPDEGMLFVFASEKPLSFWMKNTYVDLDLAYIGNDGTIRQIERMTARNTTPVRSHEPARLVLEMPAGWFAAHGVGVGTKIAIPGEALQEPDE